MLQDFRKFSKAFLYIIIAAFVGTIIFAWGADITRSKYDRDVIGEVNGQELKREQYNQVYRSYYEQIQQSSKRDLTHEEERTLLDVSWKELVSSVLYRQQIDRLGLVLTNRELAEHLKLMPPQEIIQAPVFQNEQGGFDYQKYVQSMTDPNYARVWMDIESFMRGRVTNIKLQELVRMGARVTGEDVKQEFIDNNERIKLEYAVLFRDRLGDPEIVNDTSEILEYYKNNKDLYFRPAEAGLKYVEFHKVPTESDSIAAKDQAQSIYDEIVDGADFAQLAVDFSDDIATAQSGGDVGWFNETMLIDGFGGEAIDAAFALSDSGDVSEPVKTKYGWHVIMKTGERTADNGITEIRASQILSGFVLSGQTVSDLQNAAQMFEDLCDDSGFDAAAAELGIEVKHTAGFVKGNLAGSLGEVPKANEFAFSSKVGDVSRVIEDADRLIVAQLEKFKPEGIAPVDSCFSRVDQHLTEQKLKERALAKAQEIYDLVIAGTTLTEAAEKVGAEYHVSPIISRREKAPKVGDDPNLLGTAFRLSEEEPLSKPILTNRGAAVIRFLERQAPNLELFTAEQDSIYRAMLTERGQQVIDQWHTSILERSDIEDYRDEVLGIY